MSAEKGIPGTRAAGIGGHRSPGEDRFVLDVREGALGQGPRQTVRDTETGKALCDPDGVRLLLFLGNALSRQIADIGGQRQGAAATSVPEAPPPADRRARSGR